MFTIEVNYQPLNKLYGALIQEGNVTIFEVDEKMEVAIQKAVDLAKIQIQTN